MLIAPFLLTGIAALSALFLNTSPRLGRLRKAHQGLLGQTTVYVLGCAISEYLSNSDTVQPPGLDSSPIDVQFAVTVEPPPVILLPDAAPVLLLDAAPVIEIEVPVLDWSVPEKPTVFTPKAPEVPSDVVTIDFYLNILEFAPPESSFWEEKTFVPEVPDDDAPSVWQYEYPELTSERLCLRKGMPPSSLSQLQIDILFGFRAFLVAFVLWNMASWFLDYPRNILAAWRMFRERRWPQGVPLVLPDHLLDDDNEWNWE